MSDPSAAPALLANRYRLLEIVGEGGMAVVWRAEDELLGRVVAVKLLRVQYASDPDFLRRLHSEARAAATLNDPGVVGVYDVGVDDGWHYLVMEFVPGRDLKQLIRDEAPLPPGRAVGMCAEIARAVGQAHAAGMVHRDIKPQNVLVTPSQRLKVADFGIARAITAAGTTAPGLVMGTVHYLAPEVAGGGPATPRSDVFGLGVVLYEMLTGRLPFEADSTVGVVMKIMGGAPESVDRVNPRVPPVLAGIVERAMAADPAARYPDAAALAEALDSFARWANQATGSLPAVPDRAAALAPPIPVGAGVPATAPPYRGRGTGAHQGPLLDVAGLLLALLALLAVAGLVPLWSTVRARYQTADRPLGFVRQDAQAQITVQPQPPVAPTVVLVAVPDVVGRDAADARQVLGRAGLGSTTEVETSNAVPDGRVIRQRPEAGDAVPAETVVELVVSGQAPLVVPNLAGSWASVAQALEQHGFVPVRRAVWGGNADAVDQVLALDPPPGSRWPRGAPVHVTVNSGSWLSLGVDFADNIHLRGVDIGSSVLTPGETLAFRAVWEAIAVEGESEDRPRGDYVARAELVGPTGDVVARDEHVPVGGSRPTTGWAPGEVVADDAFRLVVDPGARAGEYVLWLELAAREAPGERLPVRASAFARTENHRVRVLGITVTPAGE